MPQSRQIAFIGKNLRGTLIALFNQCFDFAVNETRGFNDDPLFPKTNVIVGEDKVFKPSGLQRTHWSNASPIRTIFREAFEAAGLPYFNPHSFRKTLGTLGEQLCQTPEEFKSWSQNLGHEDVMTAFYSYGHVQPHRQGEIIQQLKLPRTSTSQGADEIAMSVVKAMASQQMQQHSV